MTCVTIITPTYNRKPFLRKLFDSLERQTIYDFEWLIVDDGSNDHTAEEIQEILRKAKFPIRYIYKKNGGKHTALNVGIATINSDLTMIVDSDDTLSEKAIEEIASVHEKYKSKKEIGAYCFLRAFPDGTAIVPLDREEFIDSYIKYRIKGNRPGDMAEVFKTEVLKKNPFPEFEHERFLSEDVVWIQIGLEYPFVFINKKIYQCQYLDGGLSANDKLIKIASPLGSMMRGKKLMQKECGIKVNIKGAIIYDCYKCVKGNKIKDKRLKLELRERLLCIIMWPASIFFFIRWKRESTSRNER